MGCLAVRRTTASSTFRRFASKSSAIRRMHSAMMGISSGVKPRVVAAGVPMRTPLVRLGFCGSFGMAFLLIVIWTSSSLS